MSEEPIDPLESIRSQDDLLDKLRSWLSGFVGYVDRDQRRQSDKILREAVADRYEKQWSRVSAIQREFIADGKLEWVDDLEAAAIKLRAFIDRVRTAAHGYAGLFDHVRIGSEELQDLYAYDYALLDHAEKLAGAVDNVEASVGTDGLPAAIRHLKTISQEAVDLYNQRQEAVLAQE